MWYNYSNMSVPEDPEKSPDFEVDILTTYFPGEPYEMITTTLTAIQEITYPHKTYLCDEADDAFLRDFCKQNDIIHVTRDNRKDAKAGNINNALRKVATGDICVVLDPDHIPDPDFLDPILPHFANPEIGFVQIVQAYYNTGQGLVARGAAEQTFQFYGPMMMTLNAYGAVNAIGANCVFRRKALDSIGGHAAGLCEDMHTAMLLYSRGWKAVYLPEVLAKGLAPANLTTYFKQQLKWSRGSFDLLVKVYPKIFNKLTIRQKIHFGVLPFHYLSGLIYLINFLIPVLALIWSTTPWKGNIVEFTLALIPLATSALLIRTYAQKWVIEKKERGFHIIGGILQINTWWIFILGFLYTLVDKEVPYLPTPKESESATNFKIVLPNAIVAAASVAAIGYGLSEDFTPFSILMSGFALFNALIMLFGVYLGLESKAKTRFSKIPENPEKKKGLLNNLKGHLNNISQSLFSSTRFAALPLLVVIIVSALGLKNRKDEMKWQDLEPVYVEKQIGNYLGIFYPSEDTGLVDLARVEELEAEENIDFDIISFYLAWTDESIEDFPVDLLEKINSRGAIPMITWEPWASTLAKNRSVQELQEEQNVMAYIADGHFDSYIRRFAAHLADYGEPVFLRFAHEFDNPQYPWSSAGGNTPAEFVAAWRHMSSILAEEGALNAILVWNPWKARNMQRFYPGDEFVDWIGITLLDYGSQNNSGRSVPFQSLYKPFAQELAKFSRKPVMLSEFGSVQGGASQQEWVDAALTSIDQEFEEINALVLFNSAFDDNIPFEERYQADYLDWTLDSLQRFKAFQGTPDFTRVVLNPLAEESKEKFEWPAQLRGVDYKKGKDWTDNYYVPTKQVILKDFRAMKEAGINSIVFPGGNLFDRNLLKYSQELDLNVIYQFPLSAAPGFLENPQKREQLREDILERAAELRDQEHVLAYSFNFDYLNKIYAKPQLLLQRQKLVKWLQQLIRELNLLDPEKAIILNLSLDYRTAARIVHLEQYLPVDIFGLTAEPGDMSQIRRSMDMIREVADAAVLVNDVDPHGIPDDEFLKKEDVILQNWQDEWLSDKLSFDGLIDFKGRKKRAYRKLEHTWAAEPPLPEQIDLRILKPAVPLLPGTTVSYQAVVYQKGQWIPASVSENLELEWSLVKTDQFGNPLAFKILSKGAHLQLEVPPGYKDYKLLLTAENLNLDYVVQVREDLHTLLEK